MPWPDHRQAQRARLPALPGALQSLASLAPSRACWALQASRSDKGRI
jgi:hypothetical protein